MDDSSDLMPLHLEQKEEARAALVNSISSCEHFCGFSYPTDLPSSSSLAMDYTVTPFFNHANLPPSMNETPNLSAFSHFTAPVRNTHSDPPLNHNNQISSQRIVCSRASTLAMDYSTVHNTTEILHMGRQSEGTFPQHDCHQGALDIGLASMSGCFSPWVAPKLGSIMVMPENAKKGQLLLKKCLFQMLPWMREVNNCGRPDINQGSNLGITNPNNNNEAMSINNDVMLMEQNHCNPNITMASHKHLLAERNRRRKQSECLRVLQALLPGKPKKDKLSIINCAIEHINFLKDTNEDLEKHIKELQSTNLTPRSMWVSGSSSGRNLMREKGRGSMSTNIHGSSSTTSSGLMLPPSPDVIINSSHKPQNEQDIYTKTTSLGTASVCINTTLQSDHTLLLRVFALARATMGSQKLFKVLTCLKDLGFEALSVQSTFEGDTFMVDISAIANQDSSLNEAQIKDSLVNALLSTHL